MAVLIPPLHWMDFLLPPPLNGYLLVLLPGVALMMQQVPRNMRRKTVVAVYFVYNPQCISFHRRLHVRHCTRSHLGVAGPCINDICILVVAHHLVFYRLILAIIDPLETWLFILARGMVVVVMCSLCLYSLLGVGQCIQVCTIVCIVAYKIFNITSFRSLVTLRVCRGFSTISTWE